jgi:hypothetical protein
MVQPVILSGPLSVEEPAKPSVIGRRGAPRLRLGIPARLVSTRATNPCILLDLSRTGARIGLERPLVPGELAYLRVAGLEMFAEVIRSMRGDSGGINGLAFDEPLSDAAVLAVRRHAETFEQRERAALRDQARRWVNGEGPA